MKKLIQLILLATLIFGCDEEKSNTEKILSKRYWTPEDYTVALHDMQFGKTGLNNGNELPRFNNPLNNTTIQKLTNSENYKVVLDDPELGVSHKGKVAQQFFEKYQELIGLYSVKDRQDKYKYEEEFLAVLNFGLDFQILYFKNGNDEIIKDSDDPTNPNILNTLKSNENVIVSNFNLFLDEINNESVYSSSGITSYCKYLDNNFSNLILTFPEANYNPMKKKAKLLLNKSKSEEIKASLTQLINDLMKEEKEIVAEY